MDVILGIDVGGTGIKGAPVNIHTGQLTGERFRLKTPRPATPAAVAETVAKVVQHFSWTGPVGMGFPAVVKDGVVMTAGNIDKSWIGTNAKELFESATACPVTIINDADAAALAEIHLGCAKGRNGTIIMITLGTGIGTAIFLDGKLFPNTELGHMIIRKKDAERRAANSAREKNEWSWKKWGKNVTEYLNELDRLLWPDLFIIGGGASNEFPKLQSYLKTRAEIIPAQMANIAGIVGAALAPLFGGSHSTPKPETQEPAADSAVSVEVPVVEEGSTTEECASAEPQAATGEAPPACEEASSAPAEAPSDSGEAEAAPAESAAVEVAVEEAAEAPEESEEPKAKSATGSRSKKKK